MSRFAALTDHEGVSPLNETIAWGRQAAQGETAVLAVGELGVGHRVIVERSHRMRVGLGSLGIPLGPLADLRLMEATGPGIA